MKQLRINPMPPRSSHASQMVGFESVKLEMMDKLIGHKDRRRIVPVVGMAGIGKTTLAKNLYQDHAVIRNFDILDWVTITQEYTKREILSHLLHEGVDGSTEQELGDRLYQRLWGRRYLIVMDDIWDVKVWEQLRKHFPDNQNGSRIVLTTRISNFESNYVVKIGFLDMGCGWILFSRTVFGEEGCCPLELEEIGKMIVEKCRGLPLSIVVVGGLLARSEYTREYWKYVEANLNSIVNSEDHEYCLKVLRFSYDQLPVHLKPCFLYMGVFPENKMVPVSNLIRLWITEGFLKPSEGEILEDTAKEYLMELIGRNMVLVGKLGSISNIKSCHIHDLLRDLCLREAQKHMFINVVKSDNFFSQESGSLRRVVIPRVSYDEGALNALQSMLRARSLTFWDGRDAISLSNFKLLRIMSYSSAHYSYYLEHMLQLVNSRYIVLKLHPNAKFHSSISLLWNLQTLIVETGKYVTAPVEIWLMPQLRHLVSKYGINLPQPSGCGGFFVLANLSVLGKARNLICCDDVVKRIPNVKKLKIEFDGNFKGNCLRNLQKLESFHCSFSGFGDSLVNGSLPSSLRRLTISLGVKCSPHSEHVLRVIGALPLLEKLVFRFGTFERRVWETIEGQFRCLKFLRMVDCPGLETWMTESTHFPLLEHLVLELLDDLIEIPGEIGEITTLKSLKLVECRNSAVESAKRIQDDQENNFGEVCLHVDVQISDYDQIQELQSLFTSKFHLV